MSGGQCLIVEGASCWGINYWKRSLTETRVSPYIAIYHPKYSNVFFNCLGNEINFLNLCVVFQLIIFSISVWFFKHHRPKKDTVLDWRVYFIPMTTRFTVLIWNSCLKSRKTDTVSRFHSLVNKMHTRKNSKQFK